MCTGIDQGVHRLRRFCTSRLDPWRYGCRARPLDPLTDERAALHRSAPDRTKEAARLAAWILGLGAYVKVRLARGANRG
jgi:hypothetical protein